MTGRLRNKHTQVWQVTLIYPRHHYRSPVGILCNAHQWTISSYVLHSSLFTIVILPIDCSQRTSPFVYCRPRSCHLVNRPR